MFRVCFVPQQRRSMNKAQIIDMFGETIATFIQEILGDNGDEQQLASHEAGHAFGGNYIL